MTPNISKLYTKSKFTKRQVDMYQFWAWAMTIDGGMVIYIHGPMGFLYFSHLQWFKGGKSVRSSP